MDYITVREISVKWDITPRRVQMLCSDGQVPGAVKLGRDWLIPQNSVRPDDFRKKEFRKSRGFTLIEMLVVIAVIAILVSIVIPTVSNATEKAREAVDAANIRSQYGTVIMQAMTTDTDINVAGDEKIALKQQIPNWQNLDFGNGLNSIASSVVGTPAANGYAWVSCESGVVTIHYDGNGSVPVSLSYHNAVEDVFKQMISANSGSSFLVANSTYTRNNKSIRYINDNLSKTDSDIKTWAVIVSSTDKNDYKDTSKANYLISEVDISDTDMWNVGDLVPAIMQKANGTYDVGLTSLYKQTDGNSPYFVISRDANGKYAQDNDFDLDSVIRDTNQKKSFSSIDDAYAYYTTLEVIKI